MAIGNHNDLTHIVRTSDQWKNTYDKYELIPVGVLCVELVSSDVTKIKIGDGHNIFSKLPYIGDLDLSKYYTKLETDTRIKEILTQEKVVRIKGIIGSKSDLPADARCGDIYFVRQLSSSDNKYIEYIYSPDNTWEPLGGIPVDIDLSEYAKTAYVDDKIEQVNERIDDIEQHGTHTHPNKEILDQITEPYTTADKETLASLHNYDDTEIREMISQSSHTHANKDILDATSAAFTREDKSKLDQLNPYDDSTIKERITELERVAHEHSNKRILDQTTASFTKEYERKMRWIRMYTGCTGMEEGIAGLVPAAQAGEEDYVLSGSGEWVPQTGGGGTYELPIATTSTLGGIKVGDGLEIDANGKLSVVGGGGGGDSIAEGNGITITTDPQTGVKTISVNTGDHLEVDENTGELNVTDVDYEAGHGIHIGSNYNFLEYIKNSGNYDQIILTDILPKFSDTLEVDVMFGAASGLDSNREFIGTCNYDGASTVGDPFFYGIYVFNDNIRTSNITFYNHFVWTPQCTNTNFIDNPYGIDYYGNNPVRQIARMQGSTGSWGNVSRDFSDQYRSDFVDPFYPMAIFGSNHNNNVLYQYICGEITLYGVKLYDSLGTLIHDLRPVERVSDNAAGLYDVLTNKFYGNAGGGSFVKGPIITTPDRIINAKIGNGLQFDSNNAIKVVTGNGLQINQDGEVEIDLSIIPEVSQYYPGEAIDITASSDSNLPAGYAEVDYIEAPGNAYTIIDYIPNRNTKIVGTAMMIDTSTDPVVFGARTGNSGQQFVFWFNRYSSTQAKVGFVYGTNTWSTSTDCDDGKLIPYVVGDQFTFLLSLEDEFNVNGEFVHNITENGTPASDIKLGIFALTRTNTSIESNNNIFKGRIYEFKIYENDELVVNLVPAIYTSTSSVGFYDTISDTFYTSRTSTSFICDPSTVHVSGYLVNVKYNRGLTVNQDNELEVKLGDGLGFDANGALEVTGGSGGGNGGNYIEGEAIKFEEGASRLPTGYTELENISNTSASYIDTGYIPNTDTQLSIIANIHRGTTSWQTLFGARDAVNPGGTEYAFFVRLNDNYNFYPRITGDQYTYMPNQTYDEKIRIDINNTTATVTRQDGSSYSYTQTGSLSNLSTTLAIFALHNQTGYVDNGIIDLYSFKIYENNTIIKDFVPCKRNSDDAIGLIDIINNVFYTNLGTGTFTAGRILTNTSINVKYGDGLSVNQDNELEVNVGNGLLIDEDGQIAFDESVLPEAPPTYNAGVAISFNEYERGGVTFDAWDSGTGWENVCYSNSTGNAVIGYTYEAHSPISNSYVLPYGITKIKAVALDNNDNPLWTSYSWIDANDYHFASTSPEEGHYNDWFDIPEGAIKVNFGVRHSKLNASQPMNLNDIKSVIITCQTDSSEVDVWNGGIGWSNGAYTSASGNHFIAWGSEYHSPIGQDSMEIPERATKIKVDAYSRTDQLLCVGVHWLNSSYYRFGYAEGSPSYNDWIDIAENAVYINFGVRWSSGSSSSISGNDIRSVIVAWDTPDGIIEKIIDINVNYGNGLTVNQDNELEVNLGSGLQFDANELGVKAGSRLKIEADGSVNAKGYLEGEGISIDITDYLLPTGYTRIKALSSTLNGNQYINTGYKLNSDTTIDMKCTLYKRETSVWAIPLGARVYNNYGVGGMLFVTTNSDNLVPSTGVDTPSLWIESSLNYPPSGQINLWYNNIIDLHFDNHSVTCENQRTLEQSVITSQTAITATSNYDLYVFATNNGNNADYFGKMDLYELTISENNTIIHRYIPCKRDSDDKYGLYDIIDNEFKLSPNNNLFSYVPGLPIDDIDETISLLPATTSTLGGIKIGDGLAIDEDGVVSTTNIEYEAGQGIEFITTESGDSFNVKNKEYYFTDTVSCRIDGNYGPRTFTRLSDEPCLMALMKYNTSWCMPIIIGLTAESVDLSQSYDSTILHSKGTVDYKGYTWYVNADYGLANGSMVDLMGNLQTLPDMYTYSSSDEYIAKIMDAARDLIDAAELIQTIVSMDVWNGGTGWTNGDYTSGNSDTFTTSWPYTYHYDPTAYIPVPEGALKMRVIGISNENDSHFEGGGANTFDANHHHTHWVDCCTVTDEWRDIPEGTVYVQPEVKWSNGNTRTISSSDIKSVTLQFWYSDPKNNAITVKLGNGLEFDQDDAIQVKLGDGLAFDEDGAIEVTGGSGGDSIAEGEGITITTDSQTGVKTIAVNAGNGLDIDPITNELFVNGQLPEGTIIKKLTYTGNGNGSSNVIKFTKKPVGILSINGSSGTNYISAISASINSEYLHGVYGGVSTNGMPCSCKMSYNDTTNELTFTQAYNGNNDAGLIYNVNGKAYTMQYLVKGHAGSGTSENNEVSVIKSFTYIGNGNATNTIQFPETPDTLITIYGVAVDNDISSNTVPITARYLMGEYGSGGSAKYGVVSCNMSFNDTTNILTLTGGIDVGARYNVSGETYTVIYSVNEVIASSNYVEGNGIEIDPDTGEISVNIGTGLAFDPQTGAINVTGGGGGSGDTVAEGAGIEITTDQQTGNKVIAVNAGTGLQVDQTTNELEIDDSVVTEDDELSLVFVPDDYQPS